VEQIRQLFDPARAKRNELCRDVFLRAQRPLKPTEATTLSESTGLFSGAGEGAGWYVIVRGSVVYGEEGRDDHVMRMTIVFRSSSVGCVNTFVSID